MLKKHIESILLQKLAFEPTPSQSILITKISDFILNSRTNKIFLLKGFAGTGKTTMINAIVQCLAEFNYKSVLLAPTGRAAKVMSSYTGINASTIHKKIYRQKSAKDGFGKFVLSFNTHSDTFFFVDEASMIANNPAESNAFGSGNLLDDLFSFVLNSNNCKLILIGDEAQLPPVGFAISPALDKSELEKFGYNVLSTTMTDIVRQALDSGILFNSFKIRKMIENDISGYPQLQTQQFNDIIPLPGSELVEEIETSYSTVGMEDTIIVCRSNKRANKYNTGIRNQILYREEEISAGDLLMIVKNNYFWINDEKTADFIANGDIVEVLRIKAYEERYGFRFADITIRLFEHNDLELDVKIMLDTLSIDGPSLNYEDNKKLFYSILIDYSDIKGKSKQYKKVKEDPFFNALQVKFAYAVTCHKAQGGQWKHVFIDQGYITDELLNRDYYRWLYTAITRATDKVFLVNFNKQFYIDEFD